MADEEDDYMSASFIEAAAPQIQNNNKNNKNNNNNKSINNNQTRSTIRKVKPPEKVKSFKVLEEESRKEGLSNALNEENKGFRMLKMMGYKEGTGLGKDETGTVETIPLHVKRSRAGLGDEEGRKRKINKITAKRAKLDETLLSSFKGSMKNKFAVRKLEGQLKAIKQICINMDEAKGITTNELTQEPTEEEKEQEEKEKKERGEVDEPPDPEEMLVDFLALFNYTRETHHYCFFCGTRYDDDEDLKNCPGLSEEDHD